MGFKTLRNFSDSELIFDDEQTRLILQTIFKNHLDVVDMLSIDRKVRNFAQGLLLDAIDALYSLGFVEATFRSVINPSQSLRKIFYDFRDNALMHWFKYATRRDLLTIKIYEIVRTRIEVNFYGVLGYYRHGITFNENALVYLSYKV